ncbi:MAG: hypothetical protein LC637_03265 [Xanthomonadaceae bacterium]|nr:hypothetical protein [Xanthomonadaceae bacterium]
MKEKARGQEIHEFVWLMLLRSCLSLKRVTPISFSSKLPTFSAKIQKVRQGFGVVSWLHVQDIPSLVDFQPASIKSH